MKKWRFFICFSFVFISIIWLPLHNGSITFHQNFQYRDFHLIYMFWSFLMSINISNVLIWKYLKNYKYSLKISANWSVPFGLDGTWLFPGWSILSPHPDQSRDASLLLFHRVFCCIIWVVWVDFCLQSYDQEFSRFDYFPCILECCVSFSLLSSVFVCWEEGVGRSAISKLLNYMI